METTAFTLAEAHFRECQFCEEFLSLRVLPRLDNALEAAPSEKGQTYRGLFLRALSWLRTLRKLNHPSDFQAVIVASRTLFEIAVDATLMHLDPLSPHAKLRAWEESAKLKAAKQIERFFAEQGKRPPDEFDPHIAFIKTAGPRVETLRQQFWPDPKGKGRHPRSRWTGKDLAQDARLATDLLPEGSFAEFYETQYPQICWNTHGSGLAGIRFLDEAQFPGLSAIAFRECVHFALVTTKMTLIELGLLDSEMTKELEDLEFQRTFLKFVTILVPRIVDALRRAASAPDLHASIKQSLEEMRSDIAPLGHADAAMEAQIAGFVYSAAAGLNLPASTVRDCMRAMPIAAGDSAALRLQGVLRVLADTIEQVQRMRPT